TGDAGIPGQRAAVVPVGRIGVEDSEASLTQSVAAFLHEGKVYLGDELPPYLRMLVDGALRDVQETFRGLRWTGAPRDRGRRSVATPAVLREIMGAACAATAPLLGAGRVAAL